MSKNDKNENLQSLAHRYIPGGAHTYSRGDDQFPFNAPKVLAKGKGAHVWDVDGNKFLDFGMALRAVTVGYDYQPISEAAIAEIHKGNNLTRASETEILAAQELCTLIPWCEMVKFGKNGSTVTSAAIKLARAHTGRTLVARCSEHPFFSYDDWFIGSTIVNRGVPDPISSLTLTWHYNDLESLERVFKAHGKDIAAVILEPATSVEPAPGFLQGVIDMAHRYGAVTIFDEMITGFRWHLQGASQHYGVIPDLVTYGKGMANGFSVAALGGNRDIMELGGIRQTAGQRVFLMSTTHGAEMCGLGAFRETMRVYQELDVTSHLWRVGGLLCDGMNTAAKALGIQKELEFSGPGCSPVFTCRNRDGEISLPLRTLFIQEMVKGGVLMPWIAMAYAHGNSEIEHAVTAGEKAMEVYRQALTEGTEKYLVGPSIKPVFRKFN